MSGAACALIIADPGGSAGASGDPGLISICFSPNNPSDFTSSQDSANLLIGQNYIKVDYSNKQLPTYEIYLDEGEYGLHLKYKALVHGWKPGNAYIEFGKSNQFGWVIALPRADVEGTIKVDNETIQVRGIGYHDHNWLNFNFAMIIDYWYWGRIYSDNFSVIFAYIKCNKKMDNYPIQVLMLAKNEKVILSTGEYSFLQENFSYSPMARHQFPRQITINSLNKMSAVLKVNKVLEAQDMLKNFNPVFRLLAKFIFRIQPGYFRIFSDFDLEVTQGGETVKEIGLDKLWLFPEKTQAKINDGDIVLMQHINVVENGEMAAVWLKAEKEATLKKVYVEPDRIRLQPANSQMKPIYVAPDNVEVQGRVVAIIRQVT